MKMKNRRFHAFIHFWLAVSLAVHCTAQTTVRREIRIPDILGYTTLKCDFHMHTVFSDGLVWPTVRVQEAWQEGLDAIAITDHLEKSAHADDMLIRRNRSFEIAKKEGDALGLIVIRGVEITRHMPPGHMNALFIRDAEVLNQAEWRQAVAAAVEQGAFVFWNHPNWKGQRPDGIARWYDEHTEIFDKGWLRGIEAVNFDTYCPQSHRWCIDKSLTLMGNSDLHDPSSMEYGSRGRKRPFTMVFVDAKTEEGIRKALLARRTVLFHDGDLFGDVRFLGAIFEQSVSVSATEQPAKTTGRRTMFIVNRSDLDFRLVWDGMMEGIQAPSVLLLPAQGTIEFIVRVKQGSPSETRAPVLHYRVVNLRTSPEDGLPVVLQPKLQPKPNGS
ncbi:MAG TPA: Sb-PDE family phosphodiesterase [bacterium]